MRSKTLASERFHKGLALQQRVALEIEAAAVSTT